MGKQNEKQQRRLHTAPAQGIQGPAGAVTECNYSDLKPAAFWRDYISTRIPVVIRGHLQPPEWFGTERWSNAYLQDKAGEAAVMVEQRHGNSGGYGKGHKAGMTFKEFLDGLSAGKQLYLTTQEVGVGPDGHPELFAPPVSLLAGDFPLRPALVGNLVPQQMNMWMGASGTGTSSGLHHDYHDNLYILLRGRKRFRLYPPSTAPRMYTAGKVERIHPNGRIVYEGQGRVRADGADERDVRQWEADTMLAEAEEAVARGDKGAKLRLQLVEQRIEAMMADNMVDGVDDYVDSDADADSDDSEGAEEGERASKRIRRSLEKAVGIKSTPEENGSGRKSAGGKQHAKDPGAEEDPPSFCAVDLSLPDAEISRRFPKFPGKQAALVCEVNAGDMLYLPAGWFHEVTSFGDVQEGGHLAFNYWFHPPDNLDPSLFGFDRPYTCDYFPALWEQRTERMKMEHRLERMEASKGEARQQLEAADDDEQTNGPAVPQDALASRQTAQLNALAAMARARASDEEEDGNEGEGQELAVSLKSLSPSVKQLLAQHLMAQMHGGRGGGRPRTQRRRGRRFMQGRRHHTPISLKQMHRSRGLQG